ncbi:Diacylglycerol acyltransferase family protein, related [Eimeria necatrix]|uniref:Acyltransferase n=1 Tax=Eimeria necatrix TaxID=51315 RepID=U6MH13_9EIME|nr:Diacylglycerol acyltransferase family protein, related [Eimeria necatrix]CDJ62358.1 Diacylglycerol acyltransferase family protein, related [Eimeria necatrix]
MRPEGTSERTLLGRVLTVRRRHGFCSATESGKLPPSSSKNDISLVIRGALGMDLPFLQFRLKHVTALKKHLQTLRHPLHRFCPLKYPVVIDASFLSLYSQATQTAQAPESPSNNSAIYAFSNVLYRAPNAPADATCRGDNDTTLPWRRVPGVHPPDGLTFWADVRCLLMQVLVQGSLIWVPVLLVWIWRRYCTTRRRKILFVLIVLSLFLFPIRPRPGIRQWHGWRNIHRYHRTAAIIEGAEHFPPREPTIYAVFPHGIVPTAPAVMATGNFGDLLGHFRLTAASVVRWCLVYGQLIFLSDAIPADKQAMKQTLEKGSNLLVSPGGIAEIYETNSSEERLHLQDRLGIVRLAMQTGAKLVPVYCFGNSQAYRLPWGVRFLQPFARLLRIAVVSFYGRFGLPVAYRVPLLYAIGRPLQMPQADKPTKAEVVAAHKVFVEEVRRIFETYKGVYGWKDKQLKIL